MPITRIPISTQTQKCITKAIATNNTKPQKIKLPTSLSINAFLNRTESLKQLEERANSRVSMTKIRNERKEEERSPCGLQENLVFEATQRQAERVGGGRTWAFGGDPADACRSNDR